MGIIDVIIDDFICDKKYDKTFNQLLKFIYFVFDNKITSSKVLSSKNKYIKTRQSVLQYIIGNKSVILDKIRKKSTNK